jgi:deoxyribodipyrimidine photo-lyase
MSAAPVIVWFRDDLRLSDHPALHAALRTGQPLVCVYVLDEESKGLRPHGGASRWWLAQSLRALETSLQTLGQTLILRRGAAADVIPALAQESRATAAFWNRRSGRPGMAADDQVIARLRDLGLSGGTFPGSLLVEPNRITNQAGEPMKVFTPFWKRVLALGDPRKPLPAPSSLPPRIAVAGDRLEDWRLEPRTPDWAGGLRTHWTPGEGGARKRLADFLDTIRGYAANRDRPASPATSSLSPHLRFGEISPNEIVHAARFAADDGRAPAQDVDKFLSEVGWREFSYYLLHHFPDLATRNFNTRFDDFPWRSDPAGLQAWQTGRTGYPIVDAGLRQLWHTGWMHNRVRMVVASFLIKHLLIDWRAGEQWFWDTLVDADPANNTASWQWVAGSGADATPYFRIFNPVLQGEKFDAAGVYVRHWVPELARLPDSLVHKPWTATPLELAEAGVELGRTYPAPIVDHDAARQRALAALKTISG